MRTCNPHAGATVELWKKTVYHSSERKHVGGIHRQGSPDVTFHEREPAKAIGAGNA